jgi:uncharacterized protein YjbJ (UPF0337 family)
MRGFISHERIFFMEEEKRDLDAQGQKDTIKGKINKIVGKAEHKIGEITDNEEMELKGKVREMGGAVQEKAGKAERKIDEKLNPGQRVRDEQNRTSG